MGAVNQTIISCDIKGFGSRLRTTSNFTALLDGMYKSFDYAFAQAGVAWRGWYSRDSGDGMLVLAPAEVEKGTFAGTFLTDLAEALCAHNDKHSDTEQVNLRLVLHAGEITYGNRGPIGRALIDAHRLLDAQPLKDVLANWGPLAVIVSDWFYHEVVWQSPEYKAEAYRKVAVEVKETSTVGWLRAPGHELPTDQP